MVKEVASWFRDLGSEDKEKRDAAERKLLNTSRADKALVPELAGYLNSDEARHRYWSARSLSNMYEAAVDAVPSLVELLEGGDRDCRFWAVQALENIGPEATTALPKLIARLQDSAFGVRQATAYALVRVEPHGSETEASLITQLGREEHPMVREYLLGALGKIASEGAVQAIVAALEDPDLRVRTTAVIQLKCLGGAARNAQQHLENLVAREKGSNIIAQAEAAIRLIQEVPR
jgi:hypothetical protein